MDIIVVAEERLAFSARNLAHAISLQPQHSASYWTEKHYRDNEAQIGGKQGVIFLGRNSVSEDYVQMLPLVLEDSWIFCHWSGRKAVIYANQPIFSYEDACEVAGLKIGTLGEGVKTLEAGSKSVALKVLVAMGKKQLLDGWQPSSTRWLSEQVNDRASENEKRLYVDGIAKFLQDVFPRFASDS